MMSRSFRFSFLYLSSLKEEEASVSLEAVGVSTVDGGVAMVVEQVDARRYPN